MNKKKLLALVLAALMSVSGLTIAFADGTVPAGSAPAAAVMKSSGDAVTVTDAAGLAAALEAVVLQREAESTNALEDYRRGKALLFNEVLESEVRQNE